MRPSPRLWHSSSARAFDPQGHKSPPADRRLPAAIAWERVVPAWCFKAVDPPDLTGWPTGGSVSPGIVKESTTWLRAAPSVNPRTTPRATSSRHSSTNRSGGSTSFEGSVVKGTIIRIANDFVTIDVGLKSEGRVALREFSNGGAAAGGQGRRHRRHLRRPHGKQGGRGRPVAREGSPRGSLDRSRKGIHRPGTRHGHDLRSRQGRLHRRPLGRRGLPAGQPGRRPSRARRRPADGPGPAVRDPQDGPPPRQHRRVAPRRARRDPRRGPYPPDGRAVRRPGARRRRQEHHRLRRVRGSRRRRRPAACHRHRLEAHQPSVGSPAPSASRSRCRSSASTPRRSASRSA